VVSNGLTKFPEPDDSNASGFWSIEKTGDRGAQFPDVTVGFVILRHKRHIAPDRGDVAVGQLKRLNSVLA
jgi:hypothetical protein